MIGDENGREVRMVVIIMLAALAIAAGITFLT